MAGREAGRAASGGAAGSEGPSPGAPQDAPRRLGAGALLRAPLLSLAQVLARHLLHGVLGE